MQLPSTLNTLLGDMNRKRCLPAACLVTAAKPRESICLVPRSAVGQLPTGASEENLGAVGDGFVNPSSGFSALCAGRAPSPDGSQRARGCWMINRYVGGQIHPPLL